MFQGLLWAFATVAGLKAMNEETRVVTRGTQYFTQKPSLTPPEDYLAIYDHENMAIETLLLGIVSLCLMLVNVLSMIVSAFIILKVRVNNSFLKLFTRSLFHH